MAEQMANYVYLVVNTHDRTAIAIDAAWDVQGMYALAKQLDVKVRGCIYTHFHFDHCGGDIPPMMTQGRQIPPLAGAKEVEAAGGTVWAGKGDDELIKGQCHLSGVTALDDGDVLGCGDLVIHIIRTPGHTPGSICVYAAPRCLSPRGEMGKAPLKEAINKAEGGLLITGDTLFVGSCGRVDLPGSDQSQMFGSLSRLSTMDPSVIVCPGHNYAEEPFTTIGAERRMNQMMQMGIQQFPKPPELPPCVACGAGGTCGPRGFRIGRKVRIRGLQSEAGQALNGQEAVVQKFLADKERYAVRLFSASSVNLIKPDNLDTAVTEASEAKESTVRGDDGTPPPPYTAGL